LWAPSVPGFGSAARAREEFSPVGSVLFDLQDAREEDDFEALRVVPLYESRSMSGPAGPEGLAPFLLLKTASKFKGSYP